MTAVIMLSSMQEVSELGVTLLKQIESINVFLQSWWFTEPDESHMELIPRSLPLPFSSLPLCPTRADLSCPHE